jgi:hypothetical protein
VSEPRRGSELVRRTCPLGVRFFDALERRFVADGLSVTASPVGEPRRAVRSVANRSAVHTFHDLPGLFNAELPEVAAASASRARSAYRVEVVDDAGRYLPFWFEASLPERGLFELDCAHWAAPWSVPGSASPVSGIALFSAPTREPAQSFARVRAELWDPIRVLPAAWAIVEARAGDGPVQRGMCDAQGRLGLFLPYPEPMDLAPGAASSAFPLAPPLTDQTWPLELRVYYAPEQPAARIPDLCRKLAQPLATAWADTARSQPLHLLELKFGRELIVRTYDGAEPLPTLWVTSA